MHHATPLKPARGATVTGPHAPHRLPCPDQLKSLSTTAAVPFCTVPLAQTATGMFLTLGAAARQYGISKSTLSRALRDGKLSGERSADTASYRIEISELERWLAATSVARATAETVPVVQQATHVATALEQVAALQAEVAGLRELVRVHERAADHWRNMSERLSLTARQPPETPPATVIEVPTGEGAPPQEPVTESVGARLRDFWFESDPIWTWWRRRSA